MSREPTLDSLLASNAGWAGLRNLDDRMRGRAEAAGEERRRLAAIVADVVETPAGRELVEWLLNRTLRRASTPDIGTERLLVTGEQLTPYILWSEAQKALVEQLLQLVREGRDQRRST